MKITYKDWLFVPLTFVCMTLSYLFYIFYYRIKAAVSAGKMLAENDL